SENELNLFVNGKPMTLESVDASFGPAQGGLYLGGAPPHKLPPNGLQYFRGEIHGLTVRSRIKYQTGFTPSDDLQLDLDTLALYRFEEPTEGRVLDLSGLGHEATIVGAKW